MPEPTARPAFRTLQRWGIPLHFVLPALTAVLALALLWAGGVPAVLGGWILVAALPIAIGAFISVPWFVLGPAAVWLLWVVIGKIAGPQALLAETPVPLAIGLSLIGAGATWVAQRAIFAATDPGVLHAARVRVAASAADAQGSAEGSDDDEGDAGDAGASVASGAEVDIDRELAELADGAAPKPRVLVPARRPELDPDLADDEDGNAEAGDDEESGDFDEDDDDDEGGVVDDDELLDLDPEDLGEASEPKAEESEEPKKTGEAEPQPRPPRLAELPLGEDPAPLDEGGHVTEFQAISEELLAAEESEAKASGAVKAEESGRD